MLLTQDEVTAILALFQQVQLQEKQFTTGRTPLEMSFAMFTIVYRIHNTFRYDPTHVSPEQCQLLKMLQKVQSVAINGKNLHMSCDLDMQCFPRLFSLKLEKLSLRSVINAPMVVELALVDCVIEEPFFSEAFLALRAVEFERTPLSAKHLSMLAFTLRRLVVKHNDVDFDKTFFRLPPADSEGAGSGIMPWHALTHVSIRTHRMLFSELDASWERLANLSSLSLTSMGLTDLRCLSILSRCVNLVSIDLSFNSLTSVQYMASFAAHIQRLNLSNNSISNTDGIPDLKELRYLALEGNTIHEWAELRDVADGCKLLQAITLRGNPILSQVEDQHEVLPFVASIFQFRPLLVDGVRSEGTRGKVNAAFLGKHMGLFERHRSVEGLMSDNMTAPVAYQRQSMRLSESPAGSGAIKRIARSLPSEGEKPLRRGPASASPAPRQPKKRVVVRGKIQPDKQEAVVELPPSQLSTIDSSAPSFVDVDALADKHKERWLTAVSAQAAVTQRTKKKKTEPLAQAPPPPVAALTKTAIAAAGTEPGTEKKKPDEVASATSAKKKGRTVVKDSQAPTATNSAARRTKKEEDEEQDPTVATAAAVAAQISSELASSTGRVTLPSAATRPQRQNPLRDPTPLFQSFLNSLSALDWSYVNKDDQKVKGFPSGCLCFLSAICAENEEIWGVRDDDISSPTVHHTAVEVLLHDVNDGEHKYNQNRHFNKRLVRVVEFHTGYTRAVRVETTVHDSKGSAPVFSGRPVITVMFLSPLPTQPADPHIEVLTGQPYQARKKGSGLRDRANSELDWADRDIDTSKISREVLRVTRATILAAFVVDNGPLGELFLDVLKRHIQSCHSRLCESKIMREWPLFLDEGTVKRDSDRSVPVRMTPAHVLDRVKNHTDEDMNRQRIGCSNVLIPAEELRINLTTIVFPQIAKDRFLANIYANLVQVDSDIDETAVLLIVTQKTVVLAYDHNYKGRGGAVTPDTAFEEIQTLAVAHVKSISVSFNLQTLQIHQHIIQTRDSGATLSIIGALQQASNNAIEVFVRKCPYEDITAAPLLFSVGVFMRPPGKPRQVDRDALSFPLRHIGESMLPVSFIVTSTDLVLLMERSTMSDAVSIKKIEKRPLTTIVAFGVAADGLNPLLFSIIFNNLEKGKREQWVFAAQHPNTISFVYMELRQTLGQRMNTVDLTEKAYMNGV